MNEREVTNLLLAPHADDETLFACYTLLRHRPLVLLCFPGAERRMVRYVVAVNSATLEDRGGALMTGTNEVEDATDPRQAGRLRLR